MIELSPYHFDDRLLFIAVALLLNWIVGGPPSVHKALGLHALGNYLRKLTRDLDQRLNRTKRSAGDRAMRGLFVLLVILGFSVLIAANLSALFATQEIGRYGFWLEVLILALFIPQRHLAERGWRVFNLLKENKLGEARQRVKDFSPQETAKHDEHALIRQTMEYMSSAYADRVLSPIMWYLLLGLPGFVASKIITESAILLGYESERHKAYGLAASKLEAIINAIPARLSGFVFPVAAIFVPKAHPKTALKTMLNESAGIHAPQKGEPIAAAAGALDTSLGGPRSVQGFLVKDAWVGTGSAKTTIRDLRKFLLLYAIACLLNLALIATLMIPQF